MSRETHFKEGAWVGGYEYSDSDSLEEDIRDKEDFVDYFKERLLAMAVAEPRNLAPSDVDVTEHIHLEFRQIWKELKEEMHALSVLYFIRHNEDYIDNGED